MIVFAHTKFGLVRIQGSRVKRGGGGGGRIRLHKISICVLTKWLLFYFLAYSLSVFLVVLIILSEGQPVYVEYSS